MKYKYRTLEVNTTHLFDHRINEITKQGYKLKGWIKLTHDENQEGDWLMFIFEKKIVRKIRRIKNKKVVPMPIPDGTPTIRKGWDE